MDDKNTERHLAYLNGLRGLAAVFVVWHHVYLQVVQRNPFSGVMASITYPLLFGRYAVDLFIVLSGFCLMLPVVTGDGTLRGGAVRFMGRRAWRILPAYYLAGCLSWLLIKFLIGQKTGTHWDSSLPVSTRSIWTHLLLIHDAVGQDSTLNHAFWSIAVEWRIYFLFPLLVWSWRTIGGPATLVLATIASFAVFFGLQRILRPNLTAYYVALFTMGMLGASVAFSPQGIYLKINSWPWRRLTWLALAVVLVASSSSLYGRSVPFYVADCLVGVLSMCVLILVSGPNQGTLHCALSWQPLAFIGTFAYSIYLIHAPLIQVLWQYAFVPWQNQPLSMFLALSLAGIPLILGASYLFFLICERPLLKRKRKVV